jgi:hypothetical protein
MKSKNFLILLLLFLVVYCKKKENTAPEETPVPVPVPHKPIDTIKPLPYLPVFPGSWWKYVTSNGDTIRDTTSSTYKKDAYSFTMFGTTVKSDTFYVPFYDNIPIWGSRSHTGPLVWENNPLIYVVSDSLHIGWPWTIQKSGSHIIYYAKIIHKDTTIQLGGNTYYPTISILYYSYSDNSTTYQEHPYMIRYYTKNIGLIREDGIYSTPQGSIDSIIPYRTLVSYHINH